MIHTALADRALERPAPVGINVRAALAQTMVRRVFVRLIAADQRGHGAVIDWLFLAVCIAKPCQHFDGKKLAPVLELQASR